MKPPRKVERARPVKRSTQEPRLSPGDEARPGTPGTGEDICPECNGSGKDRGGETCPNCEGTGRITRGIGGA